jgi:hypothetical protein
MISSLAGRTFAHLPAQIIQRAVSYAFLMNNYNTLADVRAAARSVVARRRRLAKGAFVLESRSGSAGRPANGQRPRLRRPLSWRAATEGI